MSANSLDERMRRAVTSCVRSPDELDVLLFLARNRDRYCSPRAIAEGVGRPPAEVSVALEVLASRNLLAVRIAQAVLYRLDPASRELRSAVERTLDAAWRARGAVLELLGAAARD